MPPCHISTPSAALTCHTLDSTPITRFFIVLAGLAALLIAFVTLICVLYECGREEDYSEVATEVLVWRSSRDGDRRRGMGGRGAVGYGYGTVGDV